MLCWAISQDMALCFYLLIHKTILENGIFSSMINTCYSTIRRKAHKLRRKPTFSIYLSLCSQNCNSVTCRKHEKFSLCDAVSWGQFHLSTALFLIFQARSIPLYCISTFLCRNGSLLPSMVLFQRTNYPHCYTPFFSSHYLNIFWNLSNLSHLNLFYNKYLSGRGYHCCSLVN